MRLKKIKDEPEEGFTIRVLTKLIESRSFSVAVSSGPDEPRVWTAHRLRNARRYLREFSLDGPKKVVDIVPANL